MTRRHTVVEVLDQDTLELGSAPDADTLELTRNGQTLQQDADYILGEGDEASFAKRQRGDPWSRSDHFTAIWFTD
jgi:hypothetical protein